MNSKEQDFTKFDVKNYPNLENYKFGIVVSEWNIDITTNLLKGAEDKLIEFVDIVGPFGTLLITGHDFGNSRKLWESSFTKMSESVEPILSKYLKQKFAA